MDKLAFWYDSLSLDLSGSYKLPLQYPYRLGIQ